MRRILLSLAVGAALIATAHAQIWIMSPANQTSGGKRAPALQGALMLEDGTSFLLLEDASSHLCFEGGAC